MWEDIKSFFIVITIGIVCIILAWLALPFVLIGAILFIPFFIYCSYKAEKEMKKVLNTPEVKQALEDLQESVNQLRKQGESDLSQGDVVNAEWSELPEHIR